MGLQENVKVNVITVYIWGRNYDFFFLVMVMLVLKSQLLIINLGSNHQHRSLCVC